MKIAIVGSRNYTDRWQMGVSLALELDIHGDDVTIISGGAKGADTMAEEFARVFGLETEIYPADWEKYGMGAGIIRNATIVEHCDMMLAFYGPDGPTPGTQSSVRLAKETGKEVRVHYERKGRSED